MDRIRCGKAIEMERKRRKMTQAEAGSRLGCSRSTISVAERGSARGYSQQGYKYLQRCLLSRLAKLSNDVQGEGEKRGGKGVTKNNERDQKIQRLADGGITLVDIGKKFGISKQRVDQIIERFTPTERVCPYCGATFIVKIRDHIYCTPYHGQCYNLGRTPPRLREMERLVVITTMIGPPDVNGCWNWLGATNHTTGYGVLSWAGKCTLAHRWMWEQTVGPIPNGTCVLHRCDNQRCINPHHLFLGTAVDNAKDRNAKGRTKAGRNFSPKEVGAIRSVYSGTSDCAWLARSYGVHPITIYHVATGKTYAKFANK